ncbi:acetyl-CoA carboxylase biotin carboxylase subunit [Salegentibacter mishustinae]|uniref:Biotin carboxylase n=1 Tax=Salegentibacter mishustinae TaxID=270918 RepID=A0A0Q9ZGP4_9FLAO|nr:acetyl-CoA carboxylase biotin carboxylase subunit [Salegentibacter mishustinae]KRG29298.1 biotin carboxylase [Salegentibacter mishustinae]PNW21655.1 biotin carboxylase [Salegentibacter mishustinae]PZX64989.1 propionyl-CoA carboxylase alpha chain [Salegentibacter mishustinae]GGW88024.1 acetyl-CoA carboxylase biotin carboxylase subunit [Salegentibacter mishustinae]
MKKILVANRGEIALRVMKTIQKMGIKTVAVFSKADRNAPHVKFADEAVCIGEAPSNESYLKGDKIIEVAKELGVDGIHPGYGFLSENAGFAENVEKNGITWIGPGSKAIKIMGSKLAAKDAVKAYDIPMVPGIDEAITDPEKAKKIAKEIGFPILIKASAGGGGKGMRIVEKEKDLEDQMKRAISEAESAFGDGSVFIEKYVSSPRHIEIQVLADTHANYFHLFERECSIQRRHQKVVEEAPSVVLDDKLRKQMGKAAVKVAKACDYVGAGTVEFLFDENKNFYFLEMNTRLQVEHPVTEYITGIDLVEQQIKIARGEKLKLLQEDLKIKGHAVELRVYAEDPMDNFMPSVGKLEKYTIPKGENIRVDNGFEEGMEVPIYYDPMLAKLITYGKTREEAIQLMIKAIKEYEVEGVMTTLPFGKFVFEHEAFRSGNFDTHFVKKYYSAEKLEDEIQEEAKLAALVALKKYLEDGQQLRIPQN